MGKIIFETRAIALYRSAVVTKEKSLCLLCFVTTVFAILFFNQMPERCP